MSGPSLNWVVCQIGARERYAIARELHRRGQLAALCTDIWVPPGSIEDRLAGFAGARGVPIRERYDAGLKGARVLKEQLAAVYWQRVQAQKRGGGTLWRPIMEADRWLGARMAQRLEKSGLLRTAAGKTPPVVFAYSYAAREIFETAKRFGCRTVLGQIDAGPVDDDVVADVARRHDFEVNGYERPPQAYWENWRKECALADVIIVNSPWSREALAQAGIDEAKIHVVPLAYEGHGIGEGASFVRRYPASFSHERPLELLFLGRIEVRKGIFELLEAMNRLKDSPVRLTMVGAVQENLRERFQASHQVQWLGKVPYGGIGVHYKASDLFLLPTHSDGFALTQLEAQAYGLPILASRRCGEVVVEGANGGLIDPVSADTIEELIRLALANPASLHAMSQQSLRRAQIFTTAHAVDSLLTAVAEHH